MQPQATDGGQHKVLCYVYRFMK